jgi:hypothetical protein
MPVITEIAPEILRERHRLSPQQINSLYGKNVLKENHEEMTVALGMVGEFIAVTDVFSAAGIKFIPLKGPILSFRLFGDAASRSFRDLDLLVEPSSMSSIKAVMDSAGYREYDLSWPHEKRKQSLILKYCHDISYVHAEKQLMVEVHWRLLNRQSLNFKETEYLVKENQSAISFAGRTFTVLNNELELLYLVIHGGVHHWGRLKWLADVHFFLISQKIDGEKFCRHVRLLEAERLVALCNVLLCEFFSGSPLLPCSASSSLFMCRFSENRIQENEFSDPNSIKKLLHRLRFSMEAYPGFIYKWRVIFNTLAVSFWFGRLGERFGFSQV